VTAGTPFLRARMMFAAIAAAFARFKGRPVQLRAELDNIGAYEVKRKSSGASARSRHTVAQDKRAAVKARNKRRG